MLGYIDVLITWLMNANYITAYLMPEMPIAASSLLLFSGLPCGGKTNETEMFRYAANSSQTVMYLLRSHRRPISSHGVPIPVLFLVPIIVREVWGYWEDFFVSGWQSHWSYGAVWMPAVTCSWEIFRGIVMCCVFNDARPFMVERVEGDDQLSSCLGAN